jgi:MATE family, multidrug efflux pump
MNSNAPLVKGPIFKTLVKFSLPILGSVFLQALYGVGDLVIIGQFTDYTSVSAVATGSQVIEALMVTISGLTASITVLVGQYIGAKKGKETAKIVGTSIALFSTFAIILTVLMLASSRQIAALMQAPLAAFEQTVSYIQICSTSILFVTGFSTAISILNGLGDSKRPFMFAVAAWVINVIGDLLLVGVFKMGTAGSALTNVIGQGLALLLAIISIRKSGFSFDFHRTHIGFDMQKIKEILKIGIPLAIKNNLIMVSLLVVTSIINSMGLVSSAAAGAVGRLSSFAMVPSLAILITVEAFVAQNVGAQQTDRAKRGMFYGIALAFSLSALFYFCFNFADNALMRFFSREAAVVAAGSLYIKTASVDILLLSILLPLEGFLNGCGKTSFAMVQTLVTTFLVRIPMAYYFSIQQDATLFTVGIALIVSSSVGILMLAIYIYARLIPKLRSTQYPVLSEI